ncbi:hypothetical protein TNCV_2241612 [Trichonephila clavipes]|nr:hypothetical protein TNCV_2241612 [Trichonephila clavipes]
MFLLRMSRNEKRPPTEGEALGPRFKAFLTQVQLRFRGGKSSVSLDCSFRLLSFIRTWIFRTLSPFLISSYSTSSSTGNHISPIGFPQKKNYALTLQTSTPLPSTRLFLE